MGAACANAKEVREAMPKIKILDEGIKQSASSRVTQPETNKINVLSKQLSNISSGTQEGSRAHQHRQTLNEDHIVKSQIPKTNPGKEQLLKQREFILEKFQADLKVLEKSVMNDIIQMLKTFLNHLEQSPIYWTKVWLVSKNENSVVVAYQNSVCEIKKVRILYTKQVELVSNLLDNYAKYQQFNQYKILDYHFRFNKKYLNFYVFSEQEYAETCLESYQIDLADIKQLLRFLITTVADFHSHNYVHAGIKPSNLYIYLDDACQKQFKLDISFAAFKFSRRNQKSRETRQNEVNDLEDIAILIINLFYKGQEVRQQLKSKSVDFVQIVNQLYQNRQDVEMFTKEIIILLHRNKQALYDLSANDYLSLLNGSLCDEIPNLQDGGNILYHYEADYVCFYPLTAVRAQKTFTRFQLIDLESNPVEIIPLSAYLSEGGFYFAFKDMIGMIDIKLTSEQLEDTIEVLHMTFKQVLAGLEKKRERVDSAQQQISLSITPYSPQTQQEDQFQFNGQELSNKNNKYFHDRTYFTKSNIAQIFQIITESKHKKITLSLLENFLSNSTQYIDNQLLTMLTSPKLSELIAFFGDGGMNEREFNEMFKFRNKSQIPIYKRMIKPLKFVSGVTQFIIANQEVVFYDGQQLHTDSESKALDFHLVRMLKGENNSIILVGHKDGYLYLSNMQSCSTRTSVPVSEIFGVQKIQSYYCILTQHKLILYQPKTDKYFSVAVSQLSPQSHVIFHGSLIMYIDGKSIFRTFICQRQSSSIVTDIMTNLQKQGRLDSKVKIKMQIKTNSTEDQIGQYNVIQVLYPVSLDQICQFRVLEVYREVKQILVQRIVYGQMESFDECYMVCKSLELDDFFLSQEFDGRIRLNYVFPHGSTLSPDHCNWQTIKRAMKQLFRLKQSGIFVQEMHPNNIIVYQNRILFTTLLFKSNIPSVFSDKAPPVQGIFLEPRSFLAAQSNMTQNQIFINPNKANLYSFGLILLKYLAQYKMNNTKDQQLYLMEVANALQSVSSSSLRLILESLLKENEEQRPDCQGVLQQIRQMEQKQFQEIYFPIGHQIPDLQSERCFAVYDNQLWQLDTEFISKGNIEGALAVHSTEDGVLVLFNEKMGWIRVQQEIINFMQYEEEQPIKEFQQSNLIFSKEVEVPVFEMQSVQWCSSHYSNGDLYILGGDQISDCFIYISKRHLFKKIGNRGACFECNILELGDNLFMFENRKVTNKVRCSVLNKTHHSFTHRVIKLQYYSEVDLIFLKVQGQVLAFDAKSKIGWLISTDSFKVMRLKTNTSIDVIEPMPQQSPMSGTIMCKDHTIVRLYVQDNSVLSITR